MPEFEAFFVPELIYFELFAIELGAPSLNMTPPKIFCILLCCFFVLILNGDSRPPSTPGSRPTIDGGLVASADTVGPSFSPKFRFNAIECFLY